MAQAPAPVASFLGVAEDAQVLKLVRVHELDGEPLSVVMTYMPSQLAAGISRGALRESLHEILWHRFGLKQQRSLHTIRIARADTDVAQLLRVGLADPVMNIQSSTFLQDGRPIRWTENFFREDRYEYTAEFIWDRPPARQRPAGTATKAKGKK
jgi:GntR family transcriptional regulator